MSFDRLYALLGRIFFGAVAVCIVSLIVMLGIGWYGDQIQAFEIIQSYRWYSMSVVITLWYAVSSRGLGGRHPTILIGILVGHICVMMSYLFLVVLHVPIFVAFVMLGCIMTSLLFIRLSHWGFKCIGVLLGLSSLVLFLFFLIPLYPHTMDIGSRFQTQRSYLTIQSRDSIELLRDSKAQLRIYSGTEIRTIEFGSNNISSFDLLSGQTIVYAANSGLLQSWISIHASDGSIISLLPQTSVTIGNTIGSVMTTGSMINYALNQGTIVLSQNILYDQLDKWTIKTDKNRYISCRDGTMSLTPASTQLVCQYPRSSSIVGQTGTSGSLTFTNYTPYSGMVVYKKLSTGWVYMNSGAIGSGLEVIRSYHETAKQQYNLSFEQRLKQKTTRWLSSSELGEYIVLHKISFLARLSPQTYSRLLADYNTYLFVKGKYQGGPLRTDQILLLSLMRSH